MDPGPDSVKGIAPEHVVGGFVFAVPRRHVLPATSVPQNMLYAVRRFLQVTRFTASPLGKESLNQFDVLVVEFADTGHGGLSLAFAGTLASRARFVREAHPLFWGRGTGCGRAFPENSEFLRPAGWAFGVLHRPSGTLESVIGNG